MITNNYQIYCKKQMNSIWYSRAERAYTRKDKLEIGPLARAGVQNSVEKVWLKSTEWQRNLLVWLARSGSWLLGKQESVLWSKHGGAAGCCAHGLAKRIGVRQGREGDEGQCILGTRLGESITDVPLPTTDPMPQPERAGEPPAGFFQRSL